MMYIGLINDEQTKGETMNLNQNLNQLTVSELRKIAASFGVSGRSTMKKAELVEALSDPEIASFVALRFSVDEIDDGAQERFAEQVRESRKSDDVGRTVRAMITRDAPGSAYVNLDTSAINVASISRQRGRFVLVSDSGMTIRARTAAKAVKAWAVKLGVYLNAIETVKQF